MRCPNCGNGLDFRYRYERDAPAGDYIAEGYQFCSKCSYKRLLSRTAESGEILFATTIPSNESDYVWFSAIRSATAEGSATEVLQYIVETAPDICLVADNERRYVEVNRKAVETLGVARGDMIGRRIDEFFVIAPDISVSTAWDEFGASSFQLGVCEWSATGARFRYRAWADFLPGLHLSWLRPVPE